MQLQQVYLNFVGWQVGDWMKCMCNLSDKFVVGITLFKQIIASFLVEKKYKYLSLTGS